MPPNYPSCDFCGQCKCCPKHDCEECRKLEDASNDPNIGVKMPLEYEEIQKRIAFEIMRMMAEFDIKNIDIHEGQYNFYMKSSEYPDGIMLPKQKDVF